MQKRTTAYAVAFVLAIILAPVSTRLPIKRAEEKPVIGVKSPQPPISKYDREIRSVSDSLDMDWRLVAAVIYHESRFKNSASSHKGAVGLMQILSERYTDEYLLEPKNNIRIGTRYLKKLRKMYSPEAADSTEALKFALAAYNYGEGRVSRLIKKTAEQGEDSSHWSVVATHLPQGHHTVSYVDKVLNTYSEYKERY